MLIALGNEEVLRHLNHQEDWLKTAVISKNRILSKTECQWHYKIKTMEYISLFKNTKEELKYLENQKQESYLINNLLTLLKKENVELYRYFLSKSYIISLFSFKAL